MRYFEDFEVGQVFHLGQRAVGAEEIIAFAAQYDPQPFHVDPEAAKDSPFGGLIASGWHTAAMFMRLYVDTVLSDTDSRGSPGIDALRWRHPVRPGDTLTGTFTVGELQPSSRHHDRGTIHFDIEMVNQDDVTVLTMHGRGLFGRRPGAGDKSE